MASTKPPAAGIHDEIEGEHSDRRRMDTKTLQRICTDKGMYCTPSLNETLYFHFQGFGRIENLEAYTDVRALFLEGNAIHSIENISHMKNLRCLYLQQNLIERISGLEHNSSLVTLNLSNNFVSRIDGLDQLSNLATLVLSNNKLRHLEDVQNLRQCPSISTLDLSRNVIEDADVLDVFADMPNLLCLYLKGNPFIGKIRHFRKKVVAKIPSLNFLDDRPVFPEERRLVNAWSTGGAEAEVAERQRIQAEKSRSAEEITLTQQRYQARLRAWKVRKRLEEEGKAEEAAEHATPEALAEERQFHINDETIRHIRATYSNTSDQVSPAEVEEDENIFEPEKEGANATSSKEVIMKKDIIGGLERGLTVVEVVPEEGEVCTVSEAKRTNADSPIVDDPKTDCRAQEYIADTGDGSNDGETPEQAMQWSSALDEELCTQVRRHLFDFERVRKSLLLFHKNYYGHQRVYVSDEECRNRFAELEQKKHTSLTDQAIWSIE